MRRITKISKKTFFRFGLLVAIIAAAVLFDVYRDDSTQKEPVKETSSKQSNELNQLCLYSTFNSFKLKSASDKFSDLKLFLRTQSKFLQQHHNLRANQLAKSEPIRQYMPTDVLVHFLQLKKCQYRNPDDIAIPLS